MKKTEELFGKLIVEAGKIIAKGDLNVNSPWFYNQPVEPDSLREKRKEKESEGLADRC